MPFNEYGFHGDKSKYDLAELINKVEALERWKENVDTDAAKAAECPIPVGGIYMSFINSLNNGSYKPGVNFWTGTRWEELPSGKVLYSGNYGGVTRLKDGTAVNWNELIISDLTSELYQNPKTLFDDTKGNIGINLKENNLPQHRHPLSNETIYHHHDVAMQQSTPPVSGASVPTDPKIYAEGESGGVKKNYVMRANWTENEDFLTLNGDGRVHIQYNISHVESPMTTLNPKILENGTYRDIESASDAANHFYAGNTPAVSDERLRGETYWTHGFLPGYSVYMWRRIK